MGEDRPEAARGAASASGNVNVVFIGPCGCGKSTVAGRLVADTGAIDEQTLGRIAREAAERGQDDRRYAWILDKLRCERERGGTIFTAVWRLTSGCRRFLVIDAPGHNDFAKDTVTAMSQADVAVLVVAAIQSDGDASTACEGQICEHIQLAYTLGVRRLVVCVSKMDSEAVSYSQQVFQQATSAIRVDLHNVGFDTGRILFVPASGLAGDNVARRSEQTPWYKGPTLLEALHRADASEQRQPERPLRMPLREVMQIGGTDGVVAVGRVETGSLSPGMRLTFMPGNITANVLSVEMHHEQLDRASSGDNVNIHVDASMKELRRGMVGSSAEDYPACECSSFLAQVIVLSQPRAGELRAGCVLVVDCHTAQVPCVFEEFLSRTDRRTGKVLEMRPAALQAGDAATVRCRPQEPMCVEPFSEYPPLGRFAVRDQKTTIGIGVVQQVEQALTPPWTPSAKATAPRVKTSAGSKEFHGAGAHRSARCVAPAASINPFAAFAAKPKVHGQGGRSAAAKAKEHHDREAADTGAEADGDATDFGSSSKLAPRPCLATSPSPFAAFGAVTRQKESRPTARLGNPVATRKGSDNFSDG